MSIHYDHFFLQMRKFRDGSKLSSDEGKQVFRPEGDEEEGETWDSKLTFLLVTTSLGKFWFFA
jgi:hypothetical protein